MDITFGSLEELYKRLLPALESKADELKRIGYKYIKKEDVWNYLKETKWTKAINLSLYQMVDDIINVDPIYVDDYLKNKMASSERTINLKEE